MKTASARHCSKERIYQHNINIKSNWVVIHLSIVSFVLPRVGAFRPDLAVGRGGEQGQQGCIEERDRTCILQLPWV